MLFRSGRFKSLFSEDGSNDLAVAEIHRAAITFEEKFPRQRILYLIFPVQHLALAGFIHFFDTILKHGAKIQVAVGVDKMSGGRMVRTANPCEFTDLLNCNCRERQIVTKLQLKTALF